MLSLLAGCASKTQPSSLVLSSLRSDDPYYATRYRILNAAEQLLGAPYALGGTTPAGLDCSGLVQYAYRQAGIAVPRTTEQLYSTGKHLDFIRPGDLLFFKTAPPRISHVGIYAGSGQMIHVSSRGRGVSKANLNQPYWRQHLAGGATFLGYD